MNEKLIKDILGYVEGFGINIFAEVSIIFLLIGAVLLLCGAFVICLECYIRITGRRVNGTVVGAVKEVKIKEKIDDGKAEKEKKNSYMQCLNTLTLMDRYGKKNLAAVAVTF